MPPKMVYIYFISGRKKTYLKAQIGWTVDTNRNDQQENGQVFFRGSNIAERN